MRLPSGAVDIVSATTKPQLSVRVSRLRLTARATSGNYLQGMRQRRRFLQGIANRVQRNQSPFLLVTFPAVSNRIESRRLCSHLPIGVDSESCLLGARRSCRSLEPADHHVLPRSL